LLLVVDNGSVFTKNLTDFLDKKNFNYEKKIPETVNLSELSKYSSFILSGRRKNDKKINEINSKIIKFSNQNNFKLLGICYGAEILALTMGGTIKKSKFLQKGDESIKITKKNKLINESLDVFESHSFEISKIPENIICIGSSENCEFEIIQIKNKLIFGTQFHPEMSLDGQKLIQSFCTL
jgi:GMP synthase (glutamine-hydrolysing)